MDNGLGQRFEQHRAHLQHLAYRMLGSLAEADDAVSETWLRLASVDVETIDNLPAWLTTVSSRICLDMLRARENRREELIGHQPPDSADPTPGRDPEHEALLIDSVGRALLVLLDRLGPDERIAFVLHDMFAIPFDQIGPIVDRSTATTKKLASRARRKIHGHHEISAAELTRHRRVIDTFLTASRAGDIHTLLEVLSADVIRRADQHAIPTDRPTQVQGAQTVAEEIAVFGRNARFATPLLVDGSVGLAVAPHGRLRLVLMFTFDGDKITEYTLTADPAHLERLELALLPTATPAR